MYGNKKYPFNFSDGDEPVDVYAGPPLDDEPEEPFAEYEPMSGEPVSAYVYMGPPVKKIKKWFGKYECEHCRKPVKRKDKKCPHCGAWLC